MNAARAFPSAQAAQAAEPTGKDSDRALGALGALRARGAQRLDPVQFHFIEALARRAATQEGAVRQLLAARLADLTAAYGQRCDQAQSPGQLLPDCPAAAPAPVVRSLLADLVHRLDSAAAQAVTAATEPGDAAAGRVAAAGELKALSHFRSTWSRLRVERQLTQSLAQVPDNAGPLHSDRLVLRALHAMRDLAPSYLQRFVSSVDALVWLEQLEGGDSRTPVKAPAQRGGGGDARPRKPPRARPPRR